MITCILSDFSRVLLFPKDSSYAGSLNKLNRELSTKPGYTLLDHFYLNEELLNYLHALKEKVDLCIFTSETIQESPELIPHITPIFRKVYSALQFSTTKKSPEAYKFILEDLGKPPGEVLFIDDSQAHIQIALTIGMQAILYQSNEQLFSELEKRL